MTRNEPVNFESLPGLPPGDETDVSLRAYVSRIPPEKLALYDPDWSDSQVMEWDGNFRSDDNLMLVCCERDVSVQDFRGVLEEYIQFSKGQ